MLELMRSYVADMTFISFLTGNLLSGNILGSFLKDGVTMYVSHLGYEVFLPFIWKQSTLACIIQSLVIMISESI